MMNPHSSLTDDVVRGDDVIAPPEVFAADSRSLRALDAQGAGLVSKPASSVRLSLSALALSCLGSAIAGATIAIVAFDVATPRASRSMSSVVCFNLCRQSSWTSCLRACDASRASATQRPSVLGQYITFENAIQHFGITTSNLSRSVAFYTSIMGGVEVRNAGGDGWKGDRVYQLLMQAAIIGGGHDPAARFAANLSAAGPDVLDARYVAFDSMVLELLEYAAEGLKSHSLAPGRGAQIPWPCTMLQRGSNHMALHPPRSP